MRLRLPLFGPSFPSSGRTWLRREFGKIAYWGMAVLVPVSAVAQMSQTASAVVDSSNLGTNLGTYAVTERGPNHRVWKRVVAQTNDLGVVSYETNGGYTELATGLHHLVNGQWVES